MPHLEEQFPPVNPLSFQRPDALAPRSRQEIEAARREEPPIPEKNRETDEAPQPGSLADGIDRVTISANARVVVPVPQSEETVPVPIELIPGEDRVNPEVPELLTAQTEARNVGDRPPQATADPAINNPPAAPTSASRGLTEFNDGLEARRLTENPASDGGRAPIAATEGLIIRDRLQTTADNPVPDAQKRIVPETPPARGPALRGQVEPRQLGLDERTVPADGTLGLRGSTPLPRTEGRVNVETPAADQVDTLFPNVQETRNFGQGRSLGLNLGSLGNKDAAIALDSVDEVLVVEGVAPGPEAVEIRPQDIGTPPSLQPGFAPEPDLNEQLAPDPGGNRFTLDGTLPEGASIAPPTPPGGLEPGTPNGNNDEAPGGAPAEPREVDIARATVIDPSSSPEARRQIEPGPEDTGVVTSSLTDTRAVFEQDQEFQELQPPAFPELDNDEPFIPQPEPHSRAAIAALPKEAGAQAVQNPQPAPLEENIPAVPETEPGTVAIQNANPQALRRDNLGTDPALRSSRELRNLLRTPDERNAPPEPTVEDAGPPVTEVQSHAPAPKPVFENLEALSEKLLASLRAESAENGVTRPEEQPTAPPPPRTGEAQVTQRGLNIDRFI